MNRKSFYILVLWIVIGGRVVYHGWTSSAMIGWSCTDVSVLGSQVFGQALMDSCDIPAPLLQSLPLNYREGLSVCLKTSRRSWPSCSNTPCSFCPLAASNLFTFASRAAILSSFYARVASNLSSEDFRACSELTRLSSRSMSLMSPSLLSLCSTFSWLRAVSSMRSSLLATACTAVTEAIELGGFGWSACI